MKHQFHVGDRVIRIRDDLGNFPVGLTGVVTKCLKTGDGVYVKPDTEIPHLQGSTELGYLGANDYFELLLEEECGDVQPEELDLLLGVI